MDPALRTAATGMQAQQTRTDVIANNLANVNTTGFKRSRAHFEDLLYQTVQDSATVGGRDAETLPAVQIGLGTRLNAVQRIDSQGSLEQTGRSLDLAVEGEGYFQIQMPNGNTAYTRDGSFQVSDQGVLVTNQGYALQPSIKVPQGTSAVSISETGVVTAKDSKGADQELGRIELARFANPSGLESLGQNLFGETGASGEPAKGAPRDDGFGRVAQGYLESSNVEIVTEMVDMITAMRAYEINSKAIKNSEDMAQTTKLVDAMKMRMIGTVAFIAAVALSARAVLGQDVHHGKFPLAAHDLARGAVLTTSDIYWSDTTSFSTTSTASVSPGWIARRTIRAGELLRDPAVTRPDLVKTGDNVDVLYIAPGVSIKVRGVAIGNGAEGDEVYVKLDNRKRLRGVIVAANTVKVL